MSREDIDVNFEKVFSHTPQSVYDVRFGFTKIFAQYESEERERMREKEGDQQSRR